MMQCTKLSVVSLLQVIYNPRRLTLARQLIGIHHLKLPIKMKTFSNSWYVVQALLGLSLFLPFQVSAEESCYSFVQTLAAQKAQTAYVQTPMMQVDTGRITYDHYQRIRFRGEQTYWRKENLPFQLEFMHPGMHFIRPVQLYSWEKGQASPINFSSKYFDYSEVKSLNIEQDEPRMGFTGFRILSKLGRSGANSTMNETLVFQGASYFRGLGQDQTYGLSARGLAINTSMEGKEEFPDYTQFWIEKPTKNAEELVFCALLDSTSLTGASRFVLKPGKSTDVEITTKTYPRAGSTATEIGVAPLTSMFFHGENSRQHYGDYRPEVHDSDGLLIQQDKQWQWQPLAEVPYFNLQTTPVAKLSGFGLIQRDREFEHYQDLEATYHQRPSVWIEPLNDWGQGSIRLLRLHTDSDIVDNVVAYWTAPQASLPQELKYRLSWRSEDPTQHQLGKVVATRATNRAVDGLPGHQGRIRFIVDFNQLPKFKGSLKAIVGVEGSADTQPVVIQANPHIKGWRVIAQLYPKTCEKPIFFSLQLTDGRNPLTEMWSYPIPSDLCTAQSLEN